MNLKESTPEIVGIVAALIIIGLLYLVTLDFTPSETQSSKIIATDVDFSEYKGKEILTIDYCDSCGAGGDDLIISFTDSTQLKVYAYKYTMKIYE